MKSEEKFITLKEAAKISGYAPDYIGQLIRGGRIKGKQIYYNVAWVTTEAEIRRYLEDERAQGSPVLINKIKSGVSSGAYRRFLSILLYAVCALGTIFILFLFYIFSVNLDKAMSVRTVQLDRNGNAIHATK